MTKLERRVIEAAKRLANTFSNSGFIYPEDSDEWAEEMFPLVVDVDSAVFQLGRSRGLQTRHLPKPKRKKPKVKP